MSDATKTRDCESQCVSVRQHLRLLDQYRSLPLEELGAQERLLLFSAVRDRLRRALLTVDSVIEELEDLVDSTDDECNQRRVK